MFRDNENQPQSKAMFCFWKVSGTKTTFEVRSAEGVFFDVIVCTKWMWNLQQGFGAGGFGGRVAYRCFIFSEKTTGKGTSKCLWLLSTCDGVWVVILMPEKMIQFEFICFKWVGKHLPATVAMVNRKVRNLPPQAWDDDLFWDDEVHLQNLQIKLEFQQFGTTLRKKKQYAAPASAKIDELKTINWTRIILNLVGGWNPFEKYARQNGVDFPGENSNKIFETTYCWWFRNPIPNHLGWC